ncbi:hypothetical protein SERLA73DRAFT_81749, partial [Serpula lacrymans var. lacrymans S7.3]
HLLDRFWYAFWTLFGPILALSDPLHILSLPPHHLICSPPTVAHRLCHCSIAYSRLLHHLSLLYRLIQHPSCL